MMGYTAAQIAWDAIGQFSPSEWPKGTLEQMNPKVIYALSATRSSLPADHIVRPSPVFGAHVRQVGTSRHSTQGGTRLSDATDVFMPGGWLHALAFWREAQRIPEIGGLGLYVNRQWGRPMPMAHIDCRSDRVLWVCRANPRTGADQYIYQHTSPHLFFSVLAKGM